MKQIQIEIYPIRAAKNIKEKLLKFKEHVLDFLLLPTKGQVRERERERGVQIDISTLRDKPLVLEPKQLRLPCKLQIPWDSFLVVEQLQRKEQQLHKKFATPPQPLQACSHPNQPQLHEEYFSPRVYFSDTPIDYLRMRASGCFIVAQKELKKNMSVLSGYKHSLENRS